MIEVPTLRLKLKSPEDEAYTWLVAAFRLYWIDELTFEHDPQGDEWAIAIASSAFDAAPEDLKRRWREAGGL